MKQITKAELQDQLEVANTKVATLEWAINALRSGRVSAVILGDMTGTPIAKVGEWLKDGLPSSRNLGELFPFVQLSELIVWLEDRAAQTERNNPKVSENQLLAEIADLQTQIFDLKDDSIPPALPQAVVDILQEASRQFELRLGELFSVMMDEADHEGFYENIEEVHEDVEQIGILRARIKSALNIDFEHHGRVRLAVSHERLAETLKTTAAANAQLADV